MKDKDTTNPKKSMKDLFKSFRLKFKNREDFLTMTELQDGFAIVDIGWSNQVFVFDDKAIRQLFFELATSQTINIQKENIEFAE